MHVWNPMSIVKRKYVITTITIFHFIYDKSSPAVMLLYVISFGFFEAPIHNAPIPTWLLPNLVFIIPNEAKPPNQQKNTNHYNNNVVAVVGMCDERWLIQNVVTRTCGFLQYRSKNTFITLVKEK